jgi:hypothetical protein
MDVFAVAADQGTGPRTMTTAAHNRGQKGSLRALCRCRLPSVKPHVPRPRHELPPPLPKPPSRRLSCGCPFICQAVPCSKLVWGSARERTNESVLPRFITRPTRPRLGKTSASGMVQASLRETSMILAPPEACSITPSPPMPRSHAEAPEYPSSHGAFPVGTPVLSNNDRNLQM